MRLLVLLFLLLGLGQLPAQVVINPYAFGGATACPYTNGVSWTPSSAVASWGDKGGEQSGNLAYFNCHADPATTTNLVLNGVGLTAIAGLGSFDEVRVLDLADNGELTSVSRSTLAAMAKLRDLYLNGCGLTSLDLSSITTLKIVAVTDTPLESLDASGCSGLEILGANDTALASLDVSGCSGLTNLALWSTALSGAAAATIACDIDGIVGDDGTLNYGEEFQLTAEGYACVTNLLNKGWQVNCGAQQFEHTLTWEPQEDAYVEMVYDGRVLNIYNTGDLAGLNPALVTEVQLEDSDLTEVSGLGGYPNLTVFHITSGATALESFTLDSSTVTTLHIESTGLYNLDVSSASGISWWNNSQNGNLTNITYSAQTGALTFVAINNCNFSTAWLDQFACAMSDWADGLNGMQYGGFFASINGMSATGTNCMDHLHTVYGWQVEEY